MSFKKMVLFITAAILLCGCNKKDAIVQSIYIDFDETSSVEVANSWGVVKYNMMKLREEPKENSAIKNHLKLGSLVEIIKKENKISDFDNQFDYWYYINNKGELGWIFGSYLEIYNTKYEATKRSEQLIFGKNDK